MDISLLLKEFIWTLNEFWIARNSRRVSDGLEFEFGYIQGEIRNNDK